MCEGVPTSTWAGRHTFGGTACSHSKTSGVGQKVNSSSSSLSLMSAQQRRSTGPGRQSAVSQQPFEFNLAMMATPLLCETLRRCSALERQKVRGRRAADPSDPLCAHNAAHRFSPTRVVRPTDVYLLQLTLQAGTWRLVITRYL